MNDRLWGSRLALTLVVSSLAALAQNRSHPGLVHLGKGKWGTPDEAVAAGRFEYEGRWLPVKDKRKLERWEKQDAKSVTWDDAYKARSKHFEITTNVPRFIIELEIKPFLDEVIRTYQKVFKDEFGMRVKAGKRDQITIYNGYDDYHQREGLTRLKAGFLRSRREIVTLYEDTDPARFYSTVFHEVGHLFLHRCLPRAELPVWLDEAVATYFEGCTYSRATQSITVGFLPPDRLKSAKKQLADAGDEADATWMFVEVPRSEFEGPQYALAWSFVYYLTHVDGEKYRARFGKFLRELNGSDIGRVAEVFRRTMDIEFADICSGWRDFVMSLEQPEVAVWVRVDVKGESAIQPGDVIVSVDGIEIHSVAQFKRVWKAFREPRTVVVVRWDGDVATGDYRARLDQAEVDPREVSLFTVATLPRAQSLID